MFLTGFHGYLPLPNSNGTDFGITLEFETSLDNKIDIWSEFDLINT